MFFLLQTAAPALTSSGLVTIAMTVLTSVSAAVGGTYAWFRTELTDCKTDRKALYAEVKELNKRINELSLRVGRVESQGACDG
jgi:hypothetical protein